MRRHLDYGRDRHVPSQWEDGNPQLHSSETPLEEEDSKNAYMVPPLRPCEWNSKHTTYTTQPSNPDLDAVPTGTFEFTRHPTSSESVLLHALDGRLISPITKPRLNKLKLVYRPPGLITTLQEAIAVFILRHKAKNKKETFTK